MSQAHTAPPRFESVAAFMDWAERQDGKWELHDGIPIAMSPERADHARIKLNACIALRGGLRSKGLPCEALIDGLMVPGPGLRRFIPDVVVLCGKRLSGNTQIVDAPIVLVEVLSPSTENIDASLKLESYLALPSVQHYLLISTNAQRVIHHRRWDGDRFITAIIRTGSLELHPPGLLLLLDDLYESTDLQAQ